MKIRIQLNGKAKKHVYVYVKLNTYIIQINYSLNRNADIDYYTH